MAHLVMAGLTSRQLQVVALLSSGFSPREIAGKMGIDRLTVVWHTQKVYRKMGFHNVAQLTRWAVLHGLDDANEKITARPRVNAKMRGFFGKSASNSGFLD